MTVVAADMNIKHSGVESLLYYTTSGSWEEVANVTFNGRLKGAKKSTGKGRPASPEDQRVAVRRLRTIPSPR